jgi:hypothetical protein
MLVARQDNGRPCSFATKRELEPRGGVRTYLTDAVPEVQVEGRGSEDDLWEASGGAERAVEVDAAALVEDPVQRLGPPLVRRHAEPRDGRGLVPELRGLLRHRHPRDEVIDTPVDGQPHVAERDVGRRAGAAGVGRLRRNHDGAAMQLQQDHQHGGDVEEGEERAAFHGFDGCSVGTERSEAREGRREVRGERRGKGEIEAAAAGREARERATV